MHVVDVLDMAYGLKTGFNKPKTQACGALFPDYD